MTADKLIRFRPGNVDEPVEARAGGTFAPSRDLVARRDLARYYLLLQIAAQEEIRGRFTRDEISLVMDACNGIYWDEASWQTVWAEVADAVRLARQPGLPESTFGAKWRVEDEDGLVRRLHGLSAGAKAALADACERFWLQPTRDTGELLVELGLVETGDG